MVRKAFFIVVAAGLLCSAAIAEVNVAQVQSFQGKVLINQGNGFNLAANGLSLKPGDKILVSKEASAIVTYANGCQVSISEPKVLTVSKAAPCPAGAKIASVGSNFATPVAGGGGGLPPPVIGIGAFGAVAVTAFIADVTNKSTPISKP
jgi:hypothetical protein